MVVRLTQNLDLFSVSVYSLKNHLVVRVVQYTCIVRILKKHIQFVPLVWMVKCSYAP